MIGPFPSPPFPTYRTSPIGIATRKYSGKKRLIIDLSSPHNSTVPSINSLIPSPDFSLHYTTVSHAISLIRLAGRGAWLAKADITSAFKVLPLHPDFWHLFGVRWKGNHYFAVRLTFGCKSSPKLFDNLSELLCWILLNNYRIPFLTHLLDDFLTVDYPSSPPAHSLTCLKTAFTTLGVPLAEDKTEGPATFVEFLGIKLDTLTFQASLPQEKLHRITLIIANFADTTSCTKQQLLQLLGHLNFATRIIPQGRSFISHLLSLASSVPALTNQVNISPECRMELRLWHSLLHHWNGISFFYNDFHSSPEDLQLFTDAAPSVGYGGYYGGRWFAEEWPEELKKNQCDSDHSSALFELYPIVVAASLWGAEWSSRSILVHSDNQTTVNIINKGRSSSLPIMSLLRRLTWITVTNNFILRAAHIPGHLNLIADALSRFLFQKFRQLAPDSDPSPTPVPPFTQMNFP